MSKKVALFVDVDALQHPLRTVHNRALDPAAVVAAARAHGDLVVAQAIADWGELTPELKETFRGLGVEPVHVDRAVRSREGPQRRREVVRDVVDLEVMARMVEVLFPQAGGPEIDRFVLATTDEAAARAARLVRERFEKEVFVIGVEGVVGEALRAAATAVEVLPMPPVEPTDLEGLSKLVPLLEDLEKKKRYLNFKYIRETIVRRLPMAERSFDAAERLLSEAIGCGLLAKLKVEDKYNPGQHFTAYALDRESALWKQYGSGEPAPVHPDEPPPAEGAAPSAAVAATPVDAAPTAGAADSGGAPASGAAAPAFGAAAPAFGAAAPAFGAAAPAFGGAPARGGRSPSRGEPRPPRAEPARPAPAYAESPDDGELDPEVGPPVGAEDLGEGRGRRRGRRRRGRGNGAGGDAPPAQAPGGGPGRGRGRGSPHPQDRLGARYEAPSRFLADEAEAPIVHDDDIDEERILRARGDV